MRRRERHDDEERARDSAVSLDKNQIRWVEGPFLLPGRVIAPTASIERFSCNDFGRPVSDDRGRVQYTYYPVEVVIRRSDGQQIAAMAINLESRTHAHWIA